MHGHQHTYKINVVDAMESLTLEQYRRMVDKVFEFERLNVV